ncbi:hypothetical protein [Xenorhabdus stockiae]|uniref:hypothetical protein n=1 Tax=Xenorhabdus stockiae TaxID=351614 RepID=UPI0040634FE9
MNNDVIRDINTTLESAENLKAAGANEITLDLDSYITILKRLAKYENMKPVGYLNSLGCRDLNKGNDAVIYCNNDEDMTPLYRHPNK